MATELRSFFILSVATSPAPRFPGFSQGLVDPVYQDFIGLLAVAVRHTALHNLIVCYCVFVNVRVQERHAVPPSHPR